MSNVCCFDAMIKGRAKDVKKLTEWMQAQYQYTEHVWDSEKHSFKELEEPLCYFERNGEKINTEHHIGGKVFSFELSEEIKESDEELVTVEATGDCAWSVHYCMFEGEHSCYDIIKRGYANSKSITIKEACRELNLTFEVFSEEPGLCFAEHYLIENGDVIIDDCVDYYETRIGEYKTFDEIEKNFIKRGWKLPFDEDRFDKAKANGDDYIVVCELLENGDWPFTIY